MASAVNENLAKINCLIGKNDSIVKSTRPEFSHKICCSHVLITSFTQGVMLFEC